jgi:hypothetical protein
MSNPVWPDKSVSYVTVSNGVECTMKTHYGGVDLSVSEIADTEEKAERDARVAIARKVSQRKSFG